MIKCILVDDEIPALRYLQILLQQFPEVELVKSFNNPHKYIQERDSLDFNTCIIDIHMPGIDGLALAKLMPDKAVIFSTAFTEYAVDAFDLNAVDYLRKPYQQERLAQALAKAQIWLSKQYDEKKAAFIELNTASGKSRIPCSEITHIEVAENDRRDKDIYLHDGSHYLAKNSTMDELLALLPQGEFIRVNRKTCIAVARIIAYSAKYITFKVASEATQQVPLSPTYKDAFMERLSF